MIRNHLSDIMVGSGGDRPRTNFAVLHLMRSENDPLLLGPKAVNRR